MSKAGAFMLTGFVLTVIIFGLLKKRNVFSDFLEGAKSGITTVLNILPPIIALIIAVDMLRISGTMDLLTTAILPIADFLGISKEIIPLCIISPISGSGSMAMYNDILTNFGTDSYIGRVASVISGATETTFYAITVYYGAIGVKKTRHTVIASLCADFTSFIIASLIVKLLFYK